MASIGALALALVLLAGCPGSMSTEQQEVLRRSAERAPDAARAELLMHALATVRRDDGRAFYSDALTALLEAWWRAPAAERAALPGRTLPERLRALGCDPDALAALAATAATTAGDGVAVACPTAVARLLAPERAAAADPAAALLALVVEADARDQGVADTRLHAALMDALLRPRAAPEATRGEAQPASAEAPPTPSPGPGATASPGPPSAPAPPPAAVRTTIGPIAVRGALSAEVVGAVARRHAGGLGACFAHCLRARPELDGRLTLTFTVTPDGLAADGRALADPPADAELATCALERLARWRFPAARDDAATIVTLSVAIAVAAP